VDLAVRVLHVALLGDRLAVEARAEQLEYLALARGEAGDGLALRARLLAPVAGEAVQLGLDGLSR
jgi:hypothetical protein